MAALVSALVGAEGASAQTAPAALPSREQVELPPTDTPRPSSRASVREATPAAESCPFATSDVSVDLSRVAYAGVDGAPLPPAILALLQGIQPETGRQPVSNLCGLRDRAGEALRMAGYIASVQIPPQEITTGQAVLRVVLARLVDVEIKGSAGPYAQTLAARIARLKALDPLNRFDAERILLLANDVPGLDVALALLPAGRPGDVRGELTVRYSPWSVIANLQNMGSRQIGRASATVRAEAYGLTGLSDRTFIGTSSTLDFEEQRTVQIGHYFGNAAGQTIGGRFSYAWSRPDIGALDLRARSLVGGIDLVTPIARSLGRNATFGGGFELIEQRLRLGSLPLTRDKLRVGYIRLAGNLSASDWGGPAASLAGTLELRRGFDIFGATERGSVSPRGYTPSRLDGSPTATVLRGGFDGTLSMGTFSLGASIQGQWANDPLLSFEEFSVGNLTIGRGYDPGITGGDRAIGFRLEPRLQLPVGQTVAAQAFAFYDNVTIWNLDPLSTGNGRSLESWGGGIRSVVARRVSIELMYAHPRDRGLPGSPRVAADRLLFSITTQFDPAR